VKRALVVLLVLLVLAAGAVAAFVLYRKHQGRNIHGSSSVEFVTTQEPTKKRTPAELREIPWPFYGLDQARTRFAEGIHLRPPFRRLWIAGGASLLEFPPAIGYGRLFMSNNSGSLFALGARNGRRAWIYRTHRCTAASPALHRGTVFASFMNRGECNQTKPGLDGLVAAVSVGQGKVRWTTKIGPTESSPLIAAGRVYVGDWRGNVYALNEATGKIVWSAQTGGKVKAGVAYAAGRIFVGSYDGHVYAFDARTGKQVWRASAQPRLGSTATFYSTPAVAYGRVYLGSTDGKVYSFGATSGKLRWSHGTGGYVYSSPAVWNRRVYSGSYDHHFYCFDAATGDVRWSFDANGPISGSATVIDGAVYFATLDGRTYGLNALTGRQEWTFPDGKYSPVVADTRRLYLVGYARVYGMVPR
jgi:outer membrane protein assembly factor BamB